MINVAKLKGLIVERGTTQQAVADSIGINRSTFYRKMKNGGDFTIAEAKKIKEEIPLTDDEAIEIFLVRKSRFRDMLIVNQLRRCRHEC
ncbi:XRE family transcriptional regulator [Enterococcus faecalis]|uniref:XRE family transcriptional regulator n=1 Tax=Enterococcus faecalis TaxID=1351 RepID=UPI001E3E103F|nr:XRE family transcriptional regulator [Enterococcus faecalis]